MSEFLGNHTDFGGSDSPLSSDEAAAAKQRCGSQAWNLPVVFGPLAITYNLDGVPSLVLDGPTTAKIFNGAITTWDDPAITRSTSSFSGHAASVKRPSPHRRGACALMRNCGLR